MVDVPLASRVVEVIATNAVGGRVEFRYGSGYVVGGGVVLTAAHVVHDADEILVRDTRKAQRPAVIELIGDPDGADLALLRVDLGVAYPRLPVAQIRRDSPIAETITDGHTVGYPKYKEVSTPDGPMRETAGLDGTISASSNLITGALSLHCVTGPSNWSAPPHPGDNPWSGMSGAPVFSGPHLLGVVTRYPPREGPATLTVTPLTVLEARPDADAWWRRLGVDPGQPLPCLPSQPARPIAGVPAMRGPATRRLVVAGLVTVGLLTVGLVPLGARVLAGFPPLSDTPASQPTGSPPATTSPTPPAATPTPTPSAGASPEKRRRVETVVVNFEEPGRTRDGTVTIGVTSVVGNFTGPDGSVWAGGGGVGPGGGGVAVRPDPDAEPGRSVGGMVDLYVRTPTLTCRRHGLVLGEDLVVIEPGGDWIQVVLIRVDPEPRGSWAESELPPLDVTFEVIQGDGEPPSSSRVCA